jgi:hypothetical protein
MTGITARLCSVFFLALIILPQWANAQDSGPPRFTIDASLYPYLDRVSHDTDVSIAINARLSDRWSYFSYQNFNDVMGSGEAFFNRSEQNLRWTVSDDLPFDLAAQSILVKGSGNDVLQLGLSVRMHDVEILSRLLDRMNLIYRLTFHLKRFGSGDTSVWQMEHFFRMRFPYISDRLYLSGFLDQTFDQSLPAIFPDKPIVTEVQLGWRMAGDWYAITEYRMNEFRSGAEHNLAVGIEYKLRW